MASLIKLNAVEGLQAIADAVVLSKAFASTAQAITSSSVLVLPHSMGTIPKILALQLTCLTAENGYSVGDIINVPAMADFNGTNVRGVVALTDATNVSLVFSPNANVFVGHHKSTYVTANFTNANWSLKVVAYA